MKRVKRKDESAKADSHILHNRMNNRLPEAPYRTIDAKYVASLSINLYSSAAVLRSIYVPGLLLPAVMTLGPAGMKTMKRTL